MERLVKQLEIKLDHRIGQGNTAEIYDIGSDKILKLFREGLPKAAVDTEYKVSVAVAEILDSVPKVYERVVAQGREGIVYEKLVGNDMLKEMLKGICKMNHYAKDLAHYHLQIQTSVESEIPTVKEKLQNDIMRADMLSEEKKQKIFAYMEKLPDGNSLCHFDFHPGNVMIVQDTPYFLDWMTGCKGDACADVMRTCIMLTYGEDIHQPWAARKIVSLFQHKICRQYIKEYLNISHKAWEQVKQWELPVAAARLQEWISEQEKKKLLELVSLCLKADHYE